jgi:hypothetical protein
MVYYGAGLLLGDSLTETTLLFASLALGVHETVLLQHLHLRDLKAILSNAETEHRLEEEAERRTNPEIGRVRCEFSHRKVGTDGESSSSATILEEVHVTLLPGSSFMLAHGGLHYPAKGVREDAKKSVVSVAHTVVNNIIVRINVAESQGDNVTTMDRA